jgi:hypothetical protein
MTGHQHGSVQPSTVELVVPNEFRFLRLARLVASGAGAIAGLDIGEIEDLRIGVDELCAALMDNGDGSPLLLGFEVAPGAVHVSGTTASATSVSTSPLADARGRVARQILAVVVDDHALEVQHGRMTFRLHKQSGAASRDVSASDNGNGNGSDLHRRT